MVGKSKDATTAVTAFVTSDGRESIGWVRKILQQS
jgi:hypothetical protein